MIVNLGAFANRHDQQISVGINVVECRWLDLGHRHQLRAFPGTVALQVSDMTSPPENIEVMSETARQMYDQHGLPFSNAVLKAGRDFNRKPFFGAIKDLEGERWYLHIVENAPSLFVMTKASDYPNNPLDTVDIEVQGPWAASEANFLHVATMTSLQTQDERFDLAWQLKNAHADMQSCVVEHAKTVDVDLAF